MNRELAESHALSPMPLQYHETRQDISGEKRDFIPLAMFSVWL
jgi:hypothetical protein